MSQSILGINIFDSPYQYIAADANNSGFVTTLDLVLIRRLVLGMETEFSNNTSWRFVDASYEFPSVASISDFPESIELNGNIGQSTTVEFVGIKIGDVNFSAVPNGFNEVEDRSKSIIQIENQNFKAGDIVEVTLTKEAFDNSFGFQIGLNFDHQVLSCLAISTNELQDFSNENFHFSNEDGQLRLSWFSLDKAINSNNNDLLTIQFEVLKDGNLFDAINLEEQFQSEAYYNLNTLETRTLGLAVSNEQTKVEVSISPNPFSTSFQLAFYNDYAADFSLRIVDLQGKTVIEHNGIAIKGVNRVDINAELLLSSGMYFYQLNMEKISETGKLFKH